MIRHMFRTNIPNIFSVYMFALYRTLFRLSIGKMIFRKHFRKHLFSNLSHDTIILKTYVYKGECILMSYGKISAKQKEILEYIKQSILSHGYPPAVREICEAVHLKSTSSVHSHLETLEKNGYIRRDPSKPRAIEIIDDNFNLTRRELVNVPIVGTVTAGEPILAIENIQGYFPIMPEFVNNKQTFMLKVKGESMINAGIFDEDFILVEETPTASDNDIIVALLDDSVTVKRFFKEEDHIRLQPENDTMEPIIVPQDAPFSIVGKVIGLYRAFK